MSYRHSKYAGNEGDVIKHISLIAALDTLMRSWKQNKGNNGQVFSYCDSYAANGLNLFNSQKKGTKWSKGIGKIHSKLTCNDAKINCHFGDWKNSWRLPPEEKSSEYITGFYPGSSLFVAKLFEKNEIKNYKIRLWDINLACIEDQFKTFCKYDKSTKCFKLGSKISLYSKSAFNEINPNPEFNNHLEQADFLFVDPPSLEIPQNYKNLADTRAGNGNWTMFWFPLKGYRIKEDNPRIVESNDSINIRFGNWGIDSAKILIQYTKKCNDKKDSPSMIGCQIILVGPPDTEKCRVRNNVKNSIDYVITLFKSKTNYNIPNNLITFDAKKWGLPYGWDSPDHGVGGWSN